MNINEILSKSTEDLSLGDCSLIINELYSSFQREFSNKDRSGVYGFTQREFAFNSNKIEGSRLSKEHTTSLFETGTILSTGDIYRAKDIEEANGHFLMFNMALDTIGEGLSEDLIKKFHLALKQGVFEDRANGYPIGQYKNRYNEVWDIETVKPNDIPQAINKLLDCYHKSDKSLKSIAIFHVQYEKIHPFQDGNGRTGRIIIFRECLLNNIIPFIIRDVNKTRYILLLNEAQKTGKVEKLVYYFKEEQSWYYDNLKKFLTTY